MVSKHFFVKFIIMNFICNDAKQIKLFNFLFLASYMYKYA